MVVGLGNPGKRYSETRHNIGFKVVENLAKNKKIEFKKVGSKYLLAKGESEHTEFSLLLPLTFMNLSGKAIKEFHTQFNFDYTEMLVVCDDINLPTGKIRLRSKGSHGGHNGLLSIINEIQSTNFPRLRIGVGKNFEKEKQAEYVLSEFDENEKVIISESVLLATEICNSFLAGGVKEALKFYSKALSITKSNSTKNGVVE